MALFDGNDAYQDVVAAVAFIPDGYCPRQLFSRGYRKDTAMRPGNALAWSRAV